jgi:hypothetical protein
MVTSVVVIVIVIDLVVVMIRFDLASMMGYGIWNGNSYNWISIDRDAKSTEASSRNRRHVQIHRPAAIHASSLSFSIRPDQCKRGANQPRHHTVFNSSAGTCTLFLAHRTRQKANSMIIFVFTHAGRRTRSFGLAKGMSNWKGPRKPPASI